MKRITVISAVLCLLALAQIGQAADLQAGSYVNLWEPGIFVYDQYGQPSLIGDGYFYNTPAGQYGPFQVADPYNDRLELKISVPSTVYNVAPQQSLVIPFSTGLPAGTRIAYFSIAGTSNYDPSQMYLGLYRTRNDGTTECLWAQEQGGVVGFSGHVAYDTTIEGPFYFTLNVVPEPSTALCLLLGCASLAHLIRRRA